MGLFLPSEAKILWEGLVAPAKFVKSGKPAEYFLVPHGYDLDHLVDTIISSLEFTEKIEAINACKLVVLLDCCHAGGIPALKMPHGVLIKSSPLLPELLRVLETGSGRVVVASSLESEYSYTGTPYSIAQKEPAKGGNFCTRC